MFPKYRTEGVCFRTLRIDRNLCMLKHVGSFYESDDVFPPMRGKCPGKGGSQNTYISGLFVALSSRITIVYDSFRMRSNGR